MIIDGIDLVLEIAILIVALAIIIVGIWAAILQITIFFRYRRYNNIKVGNGRTAKTVAEELLRHAGITDVQVVKASILWFWFFNKWGNRYSPRRKKILLYKNILNNDSLTAIGLATQKVGLAIQHKNREPKMMFRAKWEIWTRLAPNLFLPIITLGLVIDLLVNGLDYNTGTFGYITIGFVGLAILYTIIALLMLFRVIGTERRAGEIALDLIRQNNLIDANNIDKIADYYKLQVRIYVLDFVLAVLNIVLDILQLLARSKAAKGRR